VSKKNESRTADKRRATLRKLVISGGVIGTANTWTKPVVESIVMPAHAQISDPLRDPCDVIIVPQTTTTYFVQVSGQVIGPNNANVPVTITATTGGQTDDEDATTNASGSYGPVQLGPFDVCVDSSQPVVTVTSPQFSDTATCFGEHVKNCPDGP
jgi:hypothetical protein